MLKNVSNKTLGILFAVLVVIALLIYIGDSSSNERSFRSNLVDIDTTAVTEIIIYPKKLSGEKVRLFEDDGSWKVELNSGNTAPVTKSKIEGLLKQLLEVKPERLAGRGSESWTEFEVDSGATRVEVYEGADKTLDLIIGKFTFQQPRTMKSYVRLANDTDVYQVNSFLGMSFNQDANSFRDHTIIEDSPVNWKNIAYSYPADSSYQLVNVGGNWQFSGGGKVDSASTATTLRQLSNIRGSEIVDINKEELPLPEYKLTIIKQDNSQIDVYGYKKKDQVIINSSENPDAYFDGNKGNLFNRVFVGMKKFKEN